MVFEIIRNSKMIKKYLFIKNKKPKLKSDIYNQLKKLDKLNHLYLIYKRNKKKRKSNGLS